MPGLSRPTCAVLLVVWTVGAIAYQLWPLRFEFAPSFHVNDAVWSEDPPGLAFSRNGMLVTARPPRRLHDALVSGGGLTLETWIAPATLAQAGPARIVSYSGGRALRNVTLGQVRDALSVRLRTSRTDPNGILHEVALPGALEAGRRHHVAVTYDLSRLRIFVDGRLRGSFRPPSGDLSNWDPGHALILGNEASGDRPWSGTMARVALYARGLAPDEVARNHARGEPAEGPAAPVFARDFTSGLREAPGSVRSMAQLHRPPVFLDGSGPVPLRPGPRNLSDVAHGLVVFAPLGALAGVCLGGGSRLARRRLLLAALAIAVGATLLEALQMYIAGRTSAVADLAAALAGAAAGMALTGRWRSGSRP